jgi:hypothetical protein
MTKQDGQVAGTFHGAIVTSTMLTLARADAEAVIEEARRHRRRRWRTNGARVAATALAVTAAVVAIRLGASGHAPGGPHRGAGRVAAVAAPMPPEIVVMDGYGRIEVVSSRTLRVIRTLAAHAEIFQGPNTLAASPSGLIFYDGLTGYGETVFSVPLAGGPARAIAPGRTPAVSPDGKLLAYEAETFSALHGEMPTGIVVRDLASGAQRTWALPAADADIPAMTWSPDGRHLAITTAVLSPVTLVLDTTAPGRTLGAARRTPLPPGVSWAGYLTARTGVGVVEAGAYPALRTSLVEVDVRTGQVIGPLTTLRGPGLPIGDGSAGPEGTIQPDPAGRYFLITGIGPSEKIPGQTTPVADGEIFLWTAGMRQPVPILHRFTLAIWAGAARR